MEDDPNKRPAKGTPVISQFGFEEKIDFSLVKANKQIKLKERQP